MPVDHRPTQALIHIDRLIANYRNALALGAGKSIIAVVKTDMSEGQLSSSRRSLSRAIYSPRFVDGKPVEFFAAVVGGKSVGVPGTVALLAEMHRRHGRRQAESRAGTRRTGIEKLSAGHHSGDLIRFDPVPPPAPGVRLLSTTGTASVEFEAPAAAMLSVTRATAPPVSSSAPARTLSASDRRSGSASPAGAAPAASGGTTRGQGSASTPGRGELPRP